MSAKIKKYRSNFCTFLGKECNVEILHAYIEKALELSIIDRYFMVDMTRVMSDHNFIISEYKRLSEKFPNRVILKNNLEQYEKLNSRIKKNGVDWGAFYKIFEELEDHDVVIKCDDDILFIDIESLESALELRYLNQQPLIMHSNCINNGVCAFHQYKEGVWRFNSELLAMYPSAGLSGPIFIDHGDVADKMHTQFVNDLNKNFNNINKYKLKKSLYLLQRISINFTFFLGKDREILKTISEQDEYLVSCKIPQLYDRPNMIIADMITSHYSYGAQKKLRNNSKINLYKNLSKKYLNKNFYKKNINKKTNTTVAIKNRDLYLFSQPLKEKFAIKNNFHNKYLSIKFNKTEKIIYENPEDRNSKIHTGIFFLGNSFSATDKPEILFQIKNGVFSNQCEIIKADGNKKWSQYPVYPRNQFHEYAFLQNKIFIKKFKKMRIRDRHNKFLMLGKGATGKWVLYFQHLDKKNINRYAQFWTIEDHSELLPVKLMEIDRTQVHFFENDSTQAKSQQKNISDMKNARGYFWTIKNHLWELEKKPLMSPPFFKKNMFSIKVINDEEEDRFLCEKNGKLDLSSDKFFWQISKNHIKNIKSKNYINFNEKKYLSKESFDLEF